MNSKEFNALKEAQLERLDGLIDMRSVGNGDDLLHTLKQAADLQSISLREAIAGYMADHTVTLYDMMRDHEVWSMDVWEAKITEQMADLLMLNAVIKEEDLERKGLNDLPALEDAPDNPDVKTAGQLDPGDTVIVDPQGVDFKHDVR